MKSATNIHMCNNQLVMTQYPEQLMKISDSISNGISLDQRMIWHRLGLKNNFQDLILNFQNIYYLLNILYNGVNLNFFNKSGIYYNNENETFYKVQIKQILA